MNRILWRHWPSLIFAVVILVVGGLFLRVSLALNAGLIRVETPTRGGEYLVVFESFNEGPASTLPVSYGDRLRRVPGIADVVPETWAYGRERHPLQMVMVRALDLSQLDALGTHFEAEMPTIRGILARGGIPGSSANRGANQHFNAVFGRTLAQTMGLEKADEGMIELAGGGEFKYVVIDIVDAHGTFDDTCMFVERDALWAAGRSRQDCTMFRTRLQPGAVPETVAATMAHSFQNFSPKVASMTETAQIANQTRAVRELAAVCVAGALLTLWVAMALFGFVVFNRLVGRQQQLAVLQLLGFSRGRLISAAVIGGTGIGVCAGLGIVLVSRFIIGDFLHGISGYDLFVPIIWTPSDDVLIVATSTIAGAFAVWRPVRWAVQHAKSEFGMI